MDAEILALLVLGATAGCASGAFGVGGAFLVVPALSLGGVPITEAAGTALIFVVVVAGISALRHAHGGSVGWTLALATGSMALVTAPLAAWMGADLGQRITAAVLAGLLLGMAAWTATGEGSSRVGALRWPWVMPLGAVAGGVSGLTGVRVRADPLARAS